MNDIILKSEYDQHDCHASEEDGCEVCERWFDQEVQKEKDATFLSALNV